MYYIIYIIYYIIYIIYVYMYNICKDRKPEVDDKT